MMNTENIDIILLEIHVIYETENKIQFKIDSISILPLNGGIRPPKTKLVKLTFDSISLEIFNLLVNDTFSLILDLDNEITPSITIKGKIQLENLNKIQIDVSHVDKDLIREFLSEEFSGHLTFLEEDINKKYNLIMIFNNEGISGRTRQSEFEILHRFFAHRLQ